LGEGVSVFATFVTKAGEAGLPFLVIGGNAVIAYGYPRQTVDFDFFVSSRDRYAWDKLVREMGYFPRQITMVFHLYKRDEVGFVPIDLMFVDHPTFQKFEAAAQRVTMQGISVRIPALMHLLALKLHAERSGGERRAGRDLNDVLHLMQLNHIKLDSPEFQDILNRYGNDSIHQQLAVLLRSGSGPGFRPPGD
jgi:predicted nucleotidyltransferase